MISHSDLFRPEVLKAQRNHWLGEIILTRPTSFTVIAALASVIAIAFAALFIFGSYTKKTIVPGQLAPAGGILKVRAPAPSLIIKRAVNEGTRVREGDVLFLLSAERKSGTNEKVDSRLIEQEESRRVSIEMQIEHTRLLHQRQTENLVLLIRQLEAEAERYADEIEDERKRAAIADEVATRYVAMAAKDYISQDQLQAKQADRIDTGLRLKAAQRQRATLLREISAKGHELAELRLRQKTELDTLSREVILSEQRLTESKAKRDITVVAPTSGVIGSINAEAGQQIDTLRPLATIAPENAELTAYLYVPSKSIGFTKVGDKVLLRYAAYPYQKYGQQRGIVTSISRTASAATELEFLAGGMPGLAPTRETELYYLVTVKPDSSAIAAYGKTWPLAAGMTLEASIERETRKLYEWVIEPLLTLHGKLNP
ncbi:HlyD family secretion protein [Pseudoduganella armeniaca]|uniref:HlyD family secretion protein n=1 Tax=Pseudoduganella armeniaca TaxID=2072590 RepID=UPI0015E6AB25|nr:HlyD family efflux transporter periplasmic adaptor subunit [Pseudoduganella armeniaca]